MPPKFDRRFRESDYGRSQDHEKENLLGEYHDDVSDEEDFFGGKVPSSSSRRVMQPDPKVQHVQRQVNEVVEIMHDNIGKVLDRGERLDDLQEKSDDLAYSASMFRVSAKGLRSHFWWQECKMRLLLLIVVVVILLIIFIPIIVKSTRQN
ncbi:vesicle-associated membrane protein 4-like [Acanthaster planci]|uniref:Vesicle-associated membrane protein 4-like n=1 Tax=Acanthaster planci TaxID=133434 RepID=A0A8B7XZN8_ACAPL|nr:vesicle-associated membrane protein 4-like [Acanthaster planci]XP_022085222.1 vesicle-associated membrane protein 4-like [Acanthaster planci]